MGRKIKSLPVFQKVSNKLNSLYNYEIFKILDEQSITEVENMYPYVTNPNMVKMNVEKQMKHIPNENNKNSDKSMLILKIEEVAELIEKYHATGIMVNETQEVVEFDRVIGFVEIDGKLVETRFGKIHYSKTGSHLVPYRKREK